MRSCLLVLACVATGWIQPLRADQSLHDLIARIDAHVNARLQKEGVQPAELSDDVEFIRRVTLDLAGRIPTVAELEDYLQSKASDRKDQLIQRLLDSPDFAFQQRDQLDIMLLQRDEYNERWREYLLEAARANRPWNQLFRETMLPEEYAANDTRPVAFLKRRTNDLDAMTNDSSTLWFGVNISCAKCHDHPLVDDWKQAHYYGMAAFFKRTFQTRKGHLGERFEGQPKYTDISGQEHQAGLMFLTGQKIDLPPVEAEGDELKKLQEQIKKAEQDEKVDDPHAPSFVPARNWSNWRSRKATNGTLRGTWPIACGRASLVADWFIRSIKCTPIIHLAIPNCLRI